MAREIKKAFEVFSPTTDEYIRAGTTDKYILDAEGNVKPCYNLYEWAQWFEDNCEARSMARTPLPTGEVVSTIFLGLDHRFRSDEQGLPILFETMVFGGKYDQRQERYCTKAEALAGHRRWVRKVRWGHNAPFYFLLVAMVLLGIFIVWGM